MAFQIFHYKVYAEKSSSMSVLIYIFFFSLGGGGGAGAFANLLDLTGVVSTWKLEFVSDYF